MYLVIVFFAIIWVLVFTPELIEKVVKATVTVTPSVNSGQCPKRFEFVGDNYVNLPSIFEDEWISSAGAIAPSMTVTFRNPETQWITAYWPLVADGQPLEASQIYSLNLLTSNKEVSTSKCSIAMLVTRLDRIKQNPFAKLGTLALSCPPNFYIYMNLKKKCGDANQNNTKGDHSNMDRFPFIKQMDAMDCGPTSLAMIAKHYGKTYSVQTLRERSSITREGTSMLDISNAAESIGMRTMGVRISFDKLAEDAPLPCIAHWKQNHFIVVYKIKNGMVFVADPAHGLVKYTRDEFLSGWASTKIDGVDQGLCLLLEPTPDFYKANDESLKKSSLRK